MQNYRDPWCASLPALHRSINGNGDLALVMPRRDAELTEYCGYWETLHYLLSVLFGWSNVSAGLAGWYRNGLMTDGEPLLEMIQRTWNDQGQLDYYAAWQWMPMCVMDPEEVDVSQVGRSGYPEIEWWRSFLRRGCEFAHDPFYGGTNPLHLGHSDGFGLDDLGAGGALDYDLKSRTAVIKVSSILAWRTGLRLLSLTLPPLKARSWRVTVVAEDAGGLGVFRKSRVTGRWFIGRHAFHLLGAE
jgi:hypothetical protein